MLPEDPFKQLEAVACATRSSYVILRLILRVVSTVDLQAGNRHDGSKHRTCKRP